MNNYEPASVRTVSFALPFDIWERIRALTLRRNISYNRFYEEFSRLIVNNDPTALKIVEMITTADVVNLTSRNYKKSGGKLDSETVYDILKKEGVV
jgi:hypothetical protein